MLALRQCDDPAIVTGILTAPGILERIRHDEREPGYIAHEAVWYWLAWDDAEPVGVFVAIWHGAYEIEVHCAVLSAATRHARTLGAAFLDLLWRDDDLLRITAPVLATLPSAANYCRKLGFVDEGVRRQACKVSGIPTDVIMLGMLRQEWVAARERLV